MTLIDFYVLQKETIEEQQHFACRLIEKAISQGNKVLVATNDAEHSSQIDHALWSFRPESFIPHSVVGAASDTTNEATSDNSGKAPIDVAAPVLISHIFEEENSHDDQAHYHDVLVNLRMGIPPQFSRFQRLAEIVIQAPQILENSRTSYAFYKKRGYPINTHKLR